MSRQERETVVRTTDSPNGPVVTRNTVVDERVNAQEPITWEEMRMLLLRGPTVKDRTWRPTVGGLLSILAGSWNLLLGLGAVIGGSLFPSLTPTFGGVTGGISTTGIAAGIFFIVIGLISIIGGIYALARRGWPIALAGSIVALFPSPLILPFIMGIFSLIFNVLGHREFWAKSKGEIM
jgi:hypothetical protein